LHQLRPEFKLPSLPDELNPMTATRSILQKLLQEPTVHFFVIAGILFALYGINKSNSGNVLEIEQSEIDARLFLQEMSSGQALSDEQREYITASYIEEQILVREAKAMNLDDDARINDILAQKMRHVLSGDIIQPSVAELQNYYADNAERYLTQATVSTDELVFDSRDPLPDSVTDLLQAGADPEAMLALSPGNVAPLPNVNRIDLANIFAPDFADRVFAAEVGQWIGPFTSNRGQHWLRVQQSSPARTPALEEIEDRVRLDWIADEEESRLQLEIDRLWERYTILINGSSE